MEIKYSKNVVGCRIGKEIFLNPDLYNYPKLYTAVLEHEQAHTDSVTKKDFLLDLSNKQLKGHKKAFYSFILSHPRTLLGFLPITKVGKHWAIDIELLIFWILAVIFFIIII
jgi:hypothetical protein